MEVIRYRQVPVPNALTEPCPVPDLSRLDNNEDLETVLAYAIGVLRSCNEDKARIRARGAQ